MFSKLALRNVRRSFRDYGVYLLTLTFGVCLFYTFNSIDGQGAMAYLSRNKNPMVEPIMMLVDIFSVFVAVVLACLILYANRFLLRRRKRELAVAELPETAQEEFDALPLKEALRRLPKDLRDVIILRYFTGLTLEETAQALDIPRGTVSTRQKKALSLLRLELTDE